MKALSIIAAALVLCSCVRFEKKDSADAIEDTTKTTAGTGKKFEMYQMSEMSLLMEQMYVDNQRLRERISKGEKIGEFPQHFLDIHKAVMTDEEENDAFFKEQAAQFIKAQQLIYSDPANAKKHFNDGVDACLSCHEVKCGGPIPRIKKLFIN